MWTKCAVMLWRDSLIAAVYPLTFQLSLQIPQDQWEEGYFVVLGRFGWVHFFLFFVCLALLCFTVAESVLSLALCSGGRATGTLGAICFRKEAMKSTPTLLGDRDQLVFKFSYILSGKTETPRTLAFRTCFGISLKTSVRVPPNYQTNTFLSVKLSAETNSSGWQPRYIFSINFLLSFLVAY